LSNPASPQLLTLTELLEWRAGLPGWGWRSPWDYLEELRRICQWSRVEVLGNPVDERLINNEPRVVPARAFFDYRLDQQPGSNHGQLSDRLFVPKWQNLQFPSETRAVWRAALEADELGATRSAHWQSAASPPLADSGVPTSAPATTEAFAPAPKLRGKRGRPRGSGAIDDKAQLDQMRSLLADGSVASVYAAAQIAAKEAEGQSERAKISRLSRKFTAQFGLQPNCAKS